MKLVLETAIRTLLCCVVYKVIGQELTVLSIAGFILISFVWAYYSEVRRIKGY